jgi:hypothetical protein
MTRCLWWAEFEAAVWPVRVVVGDVGSRDGFEMASPEDEDPVEAFASDGADPVGAGNPVTSLTCEFGWCSRLTGSLCKPVRVARAEVLLLLTRSVWPRANREIT